MTIQKIHIALIILCVITSAAGLSLNPNIPSTIAFGFATTLLGLAIFLNKYTDNQLDALNKRLKDMEQKMSSLQLSMGNRR